jgi:chemotaxis response regulator CheB
MPKAAIDTGCVDAIVPIEEMADEILRSVSVAKQ